MALLDTNANKRGAALSPSFVAVLSPSFVPSFLPLLSHSGFNAPKGWQSEHWSDGFFKDTLPNLVTRDVVHSESVVYLPFTLHCLNMIAKHIVVLTKHFVVYYLCVGELGEVQLWSSTRLLQQTAFTCYPTAARQCLLFRPSSESCSQKVPFRTDQGRPLQTFIL